jgi:hypothetical protein
MQTLFEPPEDEAESPREPVTGDGAWGKFKWVIYPLIVIAIFTHGQISRILSEILWTLFVMGLLVTAEWEHLRERKTRLYLAASLAAHLCLMTFIFDRLPEHRRVLAILIIATAEYFLLALPISLMNQDPSD